MPSRRTRTFCPLRVCALKYAESEIGDEEKERDKGEHFCKGSLAARCHRRPSLKSNRRLFTTETNVYGKVVPIPTQS